MRRVLMFPGQSSAYPAMIARARELGEAAEDVACRVAAVLGEDASRYLEPRGARLDTNRDVQIAVFVATQMHLAALEAAGVDADVSVGLSLGEYSHLVHIGALSFDDCLHLICERGTAYDASPLGFMIAVLAVTHDVIDEVLVEARAHGVAVISNYNAPTQHVIAGEPSAVTWAAKRLEDEHAAHTVVIERRVAMHTPLLAKARAAFRPHLERTAWGPVTRPYVPNVLGTRLASPTAADFVEHLSAHVTDPVRWQDTLEGIAASAPDAVFVEVGPGGVLGNMLGKRWLPLRRTRTDAPDDEQPGTHFTRMLEALGAAR